MPSIKFRTNLLEMKGSVDFNCANRTEWELFTHDQDQACASYPIAILSYYNFAADAKLTNKLYFVSSKLLISFRVQHLSWIWHPRITVGIQTKRIVNLIRMAGENVHYYTLAQVRITITHTDTRFMRAGKRNIIKVVRRMVMNT